MKKLIFFSLLFFSSSFFIYCKGQYNVLLHFNNTNYPQGSEPQGALTLVGNKLYGMAPIGGTNSDGCIFSLNTDGGGYKDLFDFNGTNGETSDGNLTLSGNLLYGMTLYGGENGGGVIFSIDTDGSSFTKLHDFDSLTGSNPGGSLILLGNTLYGMTMTGDMTHDSGCIFSIRTNGRNYKQLFNFNGTDGAWPWYDSLTRSKNKFYGTTSQGGLYGHGVIFSVDTNGNDYKDLFDFNTTNGAISPNSVTLIRNKLYGMTEAGGSYAKGNIFSIDTNGYNYKDLLDFDGTNGEGPNGDLTLKGGLLYGTTTFGGTHQYGNIFSIDTNGNGFIDLYDFYGTNGEGPGSDLTISGNVMYGTTYEGGLHNDGVIFSYTLPSVTASVVANVNCYGGNGSVSSSPSGGTQPYTYSWSRGGGTNAVASNLSAGTYTVTITDNKQSTSTASVIVTQPVALSLIPGSQSVSDSQDCNGSAFVTASGGTSAYTYLWYPAGDIRDTISTQDSITKKCAGEYCCKITDNNGCEDSVCITIGTETGILNINNSSSINIYPNPSNGVFIIALQNVNELAQVVIYNVLGKNIYQGNMNSENSKINLGKQPEGVYFYRVVNESGGLIGSGKVIIEH